jgi:hypothetical protein
VPGVPGRAGAAAGLPLAAAAVAVGAVAGWCAGGGLAVLTVPAAAVAVMNGYSKAYSP